MRSDRPAPAGGDVAFVASWRAKLQGTRRVIKIDLWYPELLNPRNATWDVLQKSKVRVLVQFVSTRRMHSDGFGLVRYLKNDCSVKCGGLEKKGVL